MEITTYEHDGQGTKHYRGPDPVIQALLGCFGSTRRPDTPPELPANVVPYPQQVGPRVTMPRQKPASVALCPSSVQADLIDWDWLGRDIREAGLDITVTRSLRP